jgi:phospholipid/cholesterol/gamma-HCH transport system substrate-binding protein
METRANFVTVGLFTLIVLAAGFAFIYWVARVDETTNLVPLNLRIEGSITGLGEGADVLFNGIKVGRVDRVTFDKQDPRIVYAMTSIKADTPVRSDSEVTIGSQGLAGVAYVSIKGGSPDAPLVLTAASGKTPMLDVGPGSAADVMETVREVAGRADKVMASLQQFIDETRGPLSKTVANTEKFSAALARNADDVDKVMNDMSELSARLNAASARVDTVLAKLDKLLGDGDGDGIVADARDTLEQYRTLAENLNKRVNAIAGNLTQFSDRGLDDVRSLVVEARRSVARIDRVVSDLQANPQRFISGGNQVKTFNGRVRK